MDVTWDYTDLAAAYDKRVDYSDAAIDDLCAVTKAVPGTLVADIGAGTGKLARKLLDRSLRVHAVEPNDAMRMRGIANTQGRAVVWSVGVGEETRLSANTYPLVTFGSSFNVTDRNKALAETRRIATPRAWFSCMWNHRDLGDRLQGDVEAIIRAKVPDFSYGSRREDQTAVLQQSGLFDEVLAREYSFSSDVPVDDYVEAWRSHGTLAKQAGASFDAIIEQIAERCGRAGSLEVPFTTRVWFARFKQ